MTSEPASRTARGIAREQLTRAILDTARQQLAESGPTQLSLRAVARELNLASSAIYRYFPSRDALLTALIIEAYDELGVTVESANARVARRSSYARRLTVLCHAVRDWAHSHPHDYALLYGTPVPGYAAPVDTVAPASRVTRLLAAIVADAHRAGLRPPEPLVRVPRALHHTIAGLREFTGDDVDDSVALGALHAWTVLIGSLTLELFGHIVGAVEDYDTYFDYVVKQLAADLGLR